MEFDGQISHHRVISLSKIVEIFTKPSRFPVEVVKTAWGGVKTVKFNGWVCFEISTLPVPLCEQSIIDIEIQA